MLKLNFKSSTLEILMCQKFPLLFLNLLIFLFLLVILLHCLYFSKTPLFNSYFIVVKHCFKQDLHSILFFFFNIKTDISTNMLS